MIEREKCVFDPPTHALYSTLTLCYVKAYTLATATHLSRNAKALASGDTDAIHRCIFL